MSTYRLTFEALDTLFFRESLPFDQTGGVELSSVFPPSIRTVAGAVRTLIGEANGVDWDAFKEKKSPLNEVIGTPEDLAPLRFRGPFLLYDGKRLYPVPAHLLKRTESDPSDGKSSFIRLFPDLDNPVRCDLGTVFLPRLEKQEDRGAKNIENAYLTEEDFFRVLQGDPPTKLIDADTLFAEEPRLGIGRDNARRTASESLLYQTRHIRPRIDLKTSSCPLRIGVDLIGVDSKYLPVNTTWIRLGGESRMASASCTSAPSERSYPSPVPDARGLLLILLTPADFGGSSSNAPWLPSGFEVDDSGPARCWRGQIAGVELRVLSCVLGRAVREGGWDMAHRKPKPVRSLVPAGSVFFCEVQGSVEEAVRALHGRHVGYETEWGRGELAAGYWK
ncbi:type III-B CRISPR module-associated Cmr3 family protein [Rhodocaloribacter sp.]